MNTRDDLHTVGAVAQAFGVVLLFVVLYVARDVCIPLALGVLFAFLLSPVVNRLQRLGLSNLYAVLLTAIVVFFGLAYFLLLFWSGMADMSAEVPKYREEILRKISSVREHASGFVGQFSSLAEEVSEAVDQEANNGEAVKDNEAGGGPEGRSQEAGLFSSWFGNRPDDDRVHDGTSPKKPLYVVEAPSQRLRLRSWTGSLGALVNPVASAGLVVVFAFFALVYRDDLRDRFTTVISRGNYVVTTEALDDAGSRISRYLLAQMILNVSFGAVFGLGLLGIGYFLSPTGEFPSVALLATVAGLVRFVPYVGPLVGGAVPLFFSIAIFPGYTVFFGVLTLIAVMELVSNNVVEPWLYGTSTGVSVVAIILAAVFWGWMWGPVGVLLATPLTVCAVVLGQYVPKFRFFATLMSEDVPIKPYIRAYQRLLSGDPHKLAEVLDAEIKRTSHLESLDAVVVPLIKCILTDRDPHGLNDAELTDRLAVGMVEVGLLREQPMRESSEQVESQEANGSVAEGGQGTSELPLGIVIAARHRGEEIIVASLAHAMREACRIEVFPTDDLPVCEVREVVACKPAFVIISLMPPRGTSQARYWCRALRESGYQGIIIVARFGRPRNFDDVFVRFRKVGANWLTTSVKQTYSKTMGLVAKSTRSGRHDSDSDS